MSTKLGQWWDRSWNPIEGCTPISEACENCWALKMLGRFKNQHSDDVRRYFDRIDQPSRRQKPTRYFICSLSDIFHGSISDEDRGDIFDQTLLNRRHTFCVLTKRPHLAAEYFRGCGPLPRNLWFLITAENQKRLDERLLFLIEIHAAVKGLHLEPLLGPVDISAAIPHVQWVVVGGENGPKARPMHPDWVRRIRDQCVAAGVKFWFKGWGYWEPIHGTGLPFIDDDEHHSFCWVDPKGNRRKSGCSPDACMLHLRSSGYQRELDGREWNELPGGEL